MAVETNKIKTKQKMKFNILKNFKLFENITEFQTVLSNLIGIFLKLQRQQQNQHKFRNHDYIIYLVLMV